LWRRWESNEFEQLVIVEQFFFKQLVLDQLVQFQ
jgi:hypothetical protein